jgi:transcriptional regulator with XRE-family HTH domain
MANKLGVFIRQKRGTESLRDLAKRCGVSHTLIDTLEKGYDPRTRKVARPTVDSLKKIAIGLGVNILELLLLAADEECTDLPSPHISQNLEILEIARKLEKLSPEKRKALETLAEVNEQSSAKEK